MSHNQVDGLLQRVEALEGIEAIRNLKARYAEAADEQLAAPSPARVSTLAEMFTEDAVADYGPFGRYEGRAQISGFFADVFPGAASWSRHFMMNPIIEVSGATATGRWYCMVQAVLRGGDASGLQPMWVRYQDVYAKTADRWRFSSVIVAFDAPP